MATDRLVEPFNPLPHRRLLAAWRFRRRGPADPGVLDYGPGGHHAEPVGNWTTRRIVGPGQSKNAIGYYESDSMAGAADHGLIVPLDRDVDFTGLTAISIVCRVRADTFVTNGRYGRFFCRSRGGGEDDHQAMLGLLYSTGTAGLIRSRIQWDPGNTQTIVSTGKIGNPGHPVAGEWFQSSAVADAGQGFSRLYWKRASDRYPFLDTEDTPNGSSIQSIASLTTKIGTNGASQDNNLVGAISYVYIYDAALSPAELAELDRLELERRWEASGGIYRPIKPSTAAQIVFPDVAPLAFQGHPATGTGSGSSDVNADAASLAFQGHQASALVAGGPQEVLPQAAPLSFTGHAATATGSGSSDVNADVAPLVFTAHAATGTGSGSSDVNADAASLAFQGHQASALVAGGPQEVLPQAAPLGFTGHPATGTGSGSSDVNADAATLAFTGHAATATGSGSSDVNADVATLTFQGHQATVKVEDGPQEVLPAPAPLGFTGHAATATGSGNAPVDAAVAPLGFTAHTATARRATDLDLLVWVEDSLVFRSSVEDALTFRDSVTDSLTFGGD